METAVANPATTPAAPEVPMLSQPHPQTHPNRLATIARLVGFQPPAIDQCRVLELGCAAGNNLIPMAVAYPNSTFLGIEPNGQALGEGLKTTEALGLKNIQLKQLDYTDVTDEFGPFDYVIAHGVFSRLTPQRQDQVLETIARVLQPQGVAFVSYNTYPGWHTRGMVRDMMRFHTKRFSDPKQKIVQARAMLDFLAKSASQGAGHETQLKAELEQLQKVPDQYLYHEFLEGENNPVYFHQFMERAAAKGLRYIGEAEAAAMAPRAFPEEVQKVLTRLAPNQVELEQYMDFLRNRMFRQTLLCHKEQTPNYQLRPEQVIEYAVASQARPVSQKPNVGPDVAETFRDGRGATITTRAPIVKAALLTLGVNWPQAIPFPQLLDMSLQALGLEANAENRGQAGPVLATFLLECYTSSSLVELHRNAPRFMIQPSEKPRTTPLIRRQAEQAPVVINLRHEIVQLPEAERHTLMLLDGQRDRAALSAALLELVEKGTLVPQHEGKPVTDPQRRRQIVEETLNQVLPRLARMALLEA